MINNLPKLKDVSLWEHQKKALKLAEKRQCFAYFMEVGTGKTATTIVDFRRLCNHLKRIPKTLILCPLIVCENWKREFKIWANERVYNSVDVLQGSQVKRVKKLITSEKKIFITNIEALSMTELSKIFYRGDFEALIIDESHRFKNPQAKRTKVVHQIADRMKWKRILSGTPILSGNVDAWAQLRILDKNLLDENFYIFRSKYYFDKNAHMKKDPRRKAWHFPDWQPIASKEQELADVINSISYRAKKEDVLKSLPPLVRKKVYVDLTSEQRHCYAQLSNNLCASLGDSHCSVNNALTIALRLQQVCSGVFKSDLGETLDLKCTKLDALKELLEEITPRHKVIVWTNWVHTYERIKKVCDGLKLKTVSIYGGQKPEERQAAVDEFNDLQSEAKICIANPAAGGVGIGLQAASYMIYFSKGYNLEHELQSEARAHRGGSEIHKSITRIDIIARETIEEDIHEALSEKKTKSEFIFELRKKRNANT